MANNQYANTQGVLVECWNPDKTLLLLQKAYDIVDSYRMVDILNWRDGIFDPTNQRNNPSIIKNNSSLCKSFPPDKNEISSCFPAGYGRVAFQLHVNNAFISNVTAGADYYSVNYFLKNILVNEVLGRHETFPSLVNYPFKINKLQFSLDINSDGTPKTLVALDKSPVLVFNLNVDMDDLSFSKSHDCNTTSLEIENTISSHIDISRTVIYEQEDEILDQDEIMRLDQERMEIERTRLDQERIILENEITRLEQERLKEERINQERLKEERMEIERMTLEDDRMESEIMRIESERIEEERIESERREEERIESERIEEERIESERREEERIESERREEERIESERREEERIESERREEERIESERIEEERIESERIEEERMREILHIKRIIKGKKRFENKSEKSEGSVYKYLLIIGLIGIIIFIFLIKNHYFKI